jgi:hypothetical protein
MWIICGFLKLLTVGRGPIYFIRQSSSLIVYTTIGNAGNAFHRQDLEARPLGSPLNYNFN